MAEPRFVPSNPFSHSGPVTGEQFCDREEEQRRLLELLGTTPPTSIALYGPERIGKSSLLRQLCEVEGPQQLPNRRFVYLDLMRIRSPEAFLRRTLAALEDKAGQHYDDLEAAITDEKAPPLVLALDEFGKALTNPAFDADFYDFLRSLTQTGRLALVIATLQPPKDLTVPSGAQVSRFFNIFRPMALGPFPDEAAARALLARGGFTEDEVNWILAHVKEPNHPYHLQVLAAALFDAKQAGLSREEALRVYRETLETATRPPRPARPAVGPPAAAASASSQAAPASASLPGEGLARGSLALAGLSLLVAVFSNLPLFYWAALGLGAFALLVFIVGLLLGPQER